MNKVYNIVISKRGKKTPEVGEFLKKIFTLTWKQVVNKYNETWLCARPTVANIDDIASAIKGLNKKINGVFISRITVEEACWDNGGAFDEAYTDMTYPGTRVMVRMMMNKE